MNIALSAVIISILLIPPVVFYLSFYIGKYPRAIPKFSLFEGILASSVISLLIHAVCTMLISSEIQFDILLKVLGGDLKNVEKTYSNSTIKTAIKEFAQYNSLLLLMMVALGRLCRFVLQKTGLHEKNEILTLYNKWWNFFDGRFADVEEYDLVFVDAVVDTADGTMIYSGYLGGFETKNGDLDRIFLRDTVRRDFKKRDNQNNDILINEPGEPLPIPGNIISVKYEKVINLNLTFIIIQDDAPSAP